MAKPASDWKPPHAPSTTVKAVPVLRKGTPAKKPALAAIRPYSRKAVTLPAAGLDHVAVPSGGSAVRVPRSPVYLGAHRGAKAPVGNVDVQFTPAATAQAAGVVSGLMWSVAPAAGSGPVDVQLDSGALAGLSGGDFADRLTLIELPSCALTTPAVAGCQKRTAVPVSRDAGTGRLAVSLASAAPAVLAADSVPAGSAGTFSATGTAPSNAWSQGGSTGGFNYSYPIDAPDSLGGDPAGVDLSYSSQEVDGMTASTNAQSSWIGSGWNYEPGYIERDYLPCMDDGIANSGDTCWGWGGDEVTLDQSGIGGKLVTCPRPRAAPARTRRPARC
jgi:hypothetical protein